MIGEVGLILGRSLQEEEFEDRIFEIFARSDTENELDSGFDALAQQLMRARADYEKVKALDDALFRRDFET